MVSYEMAKSIVLLGQNVRLSFIAQSVKSRRRLDL